jgi:predicted ATPase/DNA-binding CsgD family transcriptional regulator
MHDYVGQQLGNYRVLRLLGRGGAASVYLGEHLYLKSHAALKILNTPLRGQDTQRFLTEARILVGLSHPHIVRVLDFAMQEDLPFLVMDYAPGGTVRQRYPAGTRLPLNIIITYTQQVTSALQYAHDQRLIHRDVKPENMLLDARETLLLSDFGLALFTPQSDSYSTLAQHIAGTSLYLAPEQLQGRPQAASDQYALAVVIYEWLCGTPPFKGTPLEIALQHVSAPPPLLRSMNLALSPALEGVLLRALAKEPELRFVTVQAFFAALQQATQLLTSPSLDTNPSSVKDGTIRFDSTSISQSLWKVPTFLTPLIGREQDIVAISALLLSSEVRHLTLLGPGGIGKTRLSVQVAAELRSAFADGICFVALAAILSPDLLMPTIAHELNLPEKSLSPFEHVKEFLREKQLLLILDNFEQLVQAAPQLESLLGACPGVKILVTSRIALRIQSEQQVIVAPLELPDLKQLPAKEMLAHYASVALFIQRAQTYVPNFDVTATNAAALAEICVRLDGLPLAIELAAARIKLLPPRSLLPRLARRLQVLTRGASTLPARQQTLRATIQWSYDLLDAWEQRLFRRLSVFVDSCTLEAIEALCAALDDTGSGETISVLDGVDSLIEKSLLRLPTLEEQEEEPRLHMLETIREYGLECLAATGEMAAARQAHAEYYLRLTEEIEPKLAGPEQAVWLDRLEHEHANVRMALQWLLERGEMHHDMEMPLRFGGILRRFWLVHGHLQEGRTFLERALALSEGVTSPVRAHALNAAANIALNQGDVDRAEVLAEEGRTLYQKVGGTRGIAFSLHQLERVARARGNLSASRLLSEEALALFKLVGDKERVAWSLFRLARLHREQGEYSSAYALAHESLTMHRELGNKEGIASALFQLAHVLFVSQGDQARAHTLLEECLALYRELGDKEDMADCFSLLSQLALSQGDTDTARSLAEESLTLSREIGDREGIVESQPYLARVLAAQGNHAAARDLYEESLIVAEKMGNKINIAICLEGLAEVAVAQGDGEASLAGTHSEELPSLWAARLWGAAESLRETIGAPLPAVDRATNEPAVAHARAQSDAQVFVNAWNEGRTLSREGASVAQIITKSALHGVPPPSAEKPTEQRTPAKIQPVVSVPTNTQPAAPTPPKKAVSYPDELSAREVDVLRLVALGWSNAQIAEHLVISARTVNSHLTSIYRKIQVTSRSAATRYAIEHGLV